MSDYGKWQPIGAALWCDAVISKDFLGCQLRCVGFVRDSVTGVRFKELERVSLALLS